MKAFSIDAEDNITIFASLSEREQSGGEAEWLSGRRSLNTLAAKWPGTRLVKIWNSLPGVKPVQRFTSRAVAVRRIWEAIQHLRPVSGSPARTLGSPAAMGKTSAITVAQPTPPNKATLVVALLRDAKGATLQSLMCATGWQPHTVRGFVSGHVKKKLGLKVQSFKRDGDRVYAIKG